MKIKGFILGGPWNELIRGQRPKFMVHPEDAMNMVPVVVTIKIPLKYKLKKLIKRL